MILIRRGGGGRKFIPHDPRRHVYKKEKEASNKNDTFFPVKSEVSHRNSIRFSIEYWIKIASVTNIKTRLEMFELLLEKNNFRVLFLVLSTKLKS